MEGLRVSVENLEVLLPPSKTADLDAGIHQELTSLIFKFDDTMDGVLVAYKFDILSKDAKILNGIHPCIHATTVPTLHHVGSIQP